MPATIIALIAVLSLVPVFGVLLVRNEKAFRRGQRRTPASTRCAIFCYWIAVRMVGRPGLFQPDRLLVVGGLSLDLRQLSSRATGSPTRCRTSEQAVEASQPSRRQADRRQSDRRLIEFPKGASLYAPETLEMIADVHALVEKQAGVGNVWSLETLRRWLAEKADKSDVETLKEYVELLPPI